MRHGETTIRLPDGTVLQADIRSQEATPLGTVIFAHGSGSGRHSPRNRHVADILQKAGMETVLLDLLTREEEDVDLRTREYRFDIGLLGKRVVQTIDWTRENGASAIGIFGASTGAAAALIAAARRPDAVSAVVSRGGRPDLAGDALPEVQAPTLLIVGGNDRPVLELNREAGQRMTGQTRIEIVPGATHLFEEPGTLDQVAHLAADWFREHLAT